MSAKRIRVLVVDDSAFMRKSTSGMLTRDERIQVVGVARNGEEAIQQVRQLAMGETTSDDWRARCESLGITGQPLAT